MFDHAYLMYKLDRTRIPRGPPFDKINALQIHQLHLLQRHILHQADDAIFIDLQPQTRKNGKTVGSLGEVITQLHAIF